MALGRYLALASPLAPTGRDWGETRRQWAGEVFGVHWKHYQRQWWRSSRLMAI
jgi:hypothetical protein